jgi:DNA-directed RNA polymerase specialized sigma24 family protein
MIDPGSWDPRSPAWAERMAFALRVLTGPRYDLTPAEREDIAQEALLDLFERTRAEAPRNPEGLLRTIAHRKAMDLFRARARWGRLLGGFEGAPHDAPDPAPGPDGVLRMRVLESLPAIAETYFRAHQPECLPHLHAYFNDGSWREFAESRDARVNTAIKRWERCRNSFVEFARTRGLAWMLGECARDT